MQPASILDAEHRPPEACDAVVVGAGPAGLTAARLLEEGGLSVAVLDARPSGRAPGPCGAMLVPEAVRELSRQGLTVPSGLSAGVPQPSRCLVSDLGTGRSASFPVPWLNLAPGSLDGWLLSLLPAGAAVSGGFRCDGVSARSDGYRVSWSAPGSRAGTIACRYVVAADGARSGIRAGLLGVSPPRLWYCWQAEVPGDCGGYRAWLSGLDGLNYGWAIPKGDGSLIGFAFGSGRSVASGTIRHLGLLRDAGLPVGSISPSGAARCVSRFSPAGVAAGIDGLLLAGEAAGLASPSSLEGIWSALLSGRLAAETLLAGEQDPARSYRRRLGSLVVRLSAKSFKAEILSSGPARNMVLAAAGWRTHPLNR